MERHKQQMSMAGCPSPEGLYHPEQEKDACGVGFICNMDGRKNHTMIQQALDILYKLTHRGACSCDNRTGDGAGLQIQIPHTFLQKVTDFELPEPGAYATGLVFFMKDKDQREICRNHFERIVADEGQHLLGWRELPVNRDVLGPVAASNEPHIEQIFIQRSDSEALKDSRNFERELYLIRKRVENAVLSEALPDGVDFYIPTLSSNTIIYKGLLQPQDFQPYFVDLLDEDVDTCFALVHQRYSTNTFPAWRLAQPFRFLCHNGEINTVRGNENWMNTRQSLFKSEFFGEKIKELAPIVVPGTSDSARLDNTLELLYHTGRSLPHAMMMMVPEAWQNHETMPDARRAFYEYHSCLMEPWDGPALMLFTDGHQLGGVLDRNGLRPARYLVTKDNTVIAASETGMIDVPPENIAYKGRLQPGRMFLISIEEGRIINDEEIKENMSSRQPYRAWLDEHMVALNRLPLSEKKPESGYDNLLDQQQLFGYTLEDLRIVMKPMAANAKEALGSMGVDTPLAVLSDRPQHLANYFKQLFAQVTNPPLDAIREELVTSLVTNLGMERDLFEETPKHCELLRLEQPMLRDRDLETIRELDHAGLKSITIPMFFDVHGGGSALKTALDELFTQVEQAVDDGYTLIILSDRGAGRDQTPIPSLLATAGTHHHLIRCGKRTRCGLIIETGEAREVHHFATLIGYGAGAINPYIAFATLEQMLEDGYFRDTKVKSRDDAEKRYIKAVGQGLLKVMSKMGVSTLHSYRGAQIFEAIGLNGDVISSYFTGTSSRISGAGLDELAHEARMRYERAFPSKDIAEVLDLDVGGVYQWRRDGEHHALNPMAIATLQQSTRIRDKEGYRKFAAQVNEQSRKLCTLRGLFTFKKSSRSIPLEEVEPWTEIVKKFKTGAMSYGSISREAHETLAVAMNRMGGKSNSGEGGEEDHRYHSDPNGDSRSSAIKQVASGRFGVTSHYLVNAKEIQIKMAQGAKPGEGGQLPGFKVSPAIAKARHSTPYVGLVSPPPHHDIYSIEDLAQLIHDLKNANRNARVNVKLVSEIGVGTVAAGVSKGRADVILISGWDGGTGASPETSLKHAGLPWELGIAEAQQTLVMNDLRSRVVLECDGKLMTGRDVAVACLLGAEEFGFSSAPLVAMGCIMMRVCHLNTCPVGIATQDERLRKKFTGTPDSVINYFYLVAQELREIMAELGFRTLHEMIGQSQMLDMRTAIDHYKAKNLDLSGIFHRPQVDESVGLYCMEEQDHELDKALDNTLIEWAQPALEDAQSVEFETEIHNTHRTVGTMLSAEISRRYDEAGLPDGTIKGYFRGSAGQSFCAFGAKGLDFTIEGDANDYFGKGLSGAHLTIFPPKGCTFAPEENILIGNVAFYGATLGEAYINGMAGERFCVRNSGVRTVVEGIGDHGCEYMTGGRMVCIGKTGRNFAAGMSGGIAYVLDEKGDFIENRLNDETVEIYDLDQADDVDEVKSMLTKHMEQTGSTRARKILDEWETYRPRFIKIFPTDYRQALERLAREAEEQEESASELAGAEA